MADLAGLEQQRQALEDNLAKLRQSLKYWQTFEAEYEGLKEELVLVEPPLDAAKLASISASYNGDLVTETVVRELAGLDKEAPPRTRKQITRDIEHRQDYVQKNIETIQRQFFALESKLETFDFVASRDAETGLPLTEIEEELDEDDNVIASRTHQPEHAQGKLVESLRKAGLTKEELAGEKVDVPLKPAITNASPPITPSFAPVPTAATVGAEGPAARGDDTSPERPSIRKKSVSFTADTKAPPEIVRLDGEDGRKTVSFAEKVAVAPAAPLPDNRTVQFSPRVEEIPAEPLGPPSPHVRASNPDADSEKQKDLRASFKPGDRVKTIGDDDEVISEDIVLPENETEEDARLRREMLDYHLHEVGHVVAQMDLDDTDTYNYGDLEDDEDDDDDENSSHFTGSTRHEDEDTPYTTGTSDDDDEEEDEYGRTKGRVLTDEYKKQMQAMQARLIGNLGPAPAEADLRDVDEEIDPGDVRKLVIRGDEGKPASAVGSSDAAAGAEKTDVRKKRVSFAEELDVAPTAAATVIPPAKAPKHTENETAAPIVVADVGERTVAAATPPQPPSTAAAAAAAATKTSRFKSARSQPRPPISSEEEGGEEATPPPFAPGQILADSLFERPSTTTSANKPPSPEDMDPIAERRQLAAEYYRRRNEMIRSQEGGFLGSKGEKEEDEALGQWMEERDGKVRKVSRFRAARIGG